jgi:hypothetical protein
LAALVFCARSEMATEDGVGHGGMMECRNRGMPRPGLYSSRINTAPRSFNRKPSLKEFELEDGLRTF